MGANGHETGWVGWGGGGARVASTRSSDKRLMWGRDAVTPYLLGLIPRASKSPEVQIWPRAVLVSASGSAWGVVCFCSGGLEKRQRNEATLCPRRADGAELMALIHKAVFDPPPRPENKPLPSSCAAPWPETDTSGGSAQDDRSRQTVKAFNKTKTFKGCPKEKTTNTKRNKRLNKMAPSRGGAGAQYTRPRPGFWGSLRRPR